MNSNDCFPQKLDGKQADKKAGATGQHLCDWGCLKKPLPECGKNEEEMWLKLKESGIKRAIDFAKRNLEQTRENEYERYKAFGILNQNDANPFITKKKQKQRELGAKEFTLTYSPKWCDDATARHQMKIAIERLVKYYDGNIDKLRAVGEVGTNGLSHIHCFYRLSNGVKITDKNFKRAWKYWNPQKPLGWGFEGGHHAQVKNESDFLGYIDKDIDTAWLDININQETADPT